MDIEFIDPMTALLSKNMISSSWVTKSINKAHGNDAEFNKNVVFYISK